MLSFFILSAAIAVASAAYLTEAPATVYEAAQKSPQNGDYDADKKMFAVHDCWYNDKLVHYYKFRMYTPSTYPNTIVPGAANKVPIGKVFIPTKDGTMSGIVAQKPVLEFHTADGESYSDFVQIVFVTVADDYVADTIKSTEDLGDLVQTPSGMYANLPVVPTGSTLQSPADKTKTAPISPLMAFYKGVEVQTFVFEVTDASLATLWASTRGEAKDEFAYKIVVVADLFQSEQIAAIPLWHLNQHWRGVTTGVDNGGPNPNGMRNIINLDRGDAGYSPLWKIEWVTELPVGYSVDQASNADQLTQTGFKVAPTPMLVNCPDVGDIGAAVNPKKAAAFEAEKSGRSAVIEGALIMQGGVEVEAKVGETVVGTATTNPMGGFQIEVTLELGEQTVLVLKKEGAVEIFTKTITVWEATSGSSSNSTTTTTGGADATTTAASGPSGKEPTPESDSASIVQLTIATGVAALVALF